MKNKDKSMNDILRATQYNSKAHDVLLKLLTKQKKRVNSFDNARSQTWNPPDEIKPGPDYA